MRSALTWVQRRTYRDYGRAAPDADGASYAYPGSSDAWTRPPAPDDVCAIVSLRPGGATVPFGCGGGNGGTAIALSPSAPPAPASVPSTAKAPETSVQSGRVSSTIRPLRSGPAIESRPRAVLSRSYPEEANRLTGCRIGTICRSPHPTINALLSRRDPDAYLFSRYAGKRMPTTLIDRWQAICADAQIGRMRLHDLRHTAASQAVMSGEGLSQVGRLLGHRRDRTTAIYAHLADAHRVEAAEKVGHFVARAMRLSDVGEPRQPSP
ncbi:MAG: tyrosine-type recombinase/integrase [Defluviicoccus sp.]|nr:tyrosine-type recombinase/integrase [Defluviicoccus sp.]